MRYEIKIYQAIYMYSICKVYTYIIYIEGLKNEKGYEPLVQPKKDNESFFLYS